MDNQTYKWGVMQSEFFSRLVDKFNREGIRYFILRNWELLPEQNIGKDVDIVIDPQKYSATARVLISIMKELDIGYYTVVQFGTMRCWYITDIQKEFAIHIDIISNELYKGFEFFDFDTLYQHTEKQKAFTVLNKSFDIVMLIVQNIVAYKSLKPKYRQKITDNYFDYKSEIDEIIIDFWGIKLGRFVVECLSNSDFNTIVSNAKKLERGAMKRIFINKPLRTTYFFTQFVFNKLYRVVVCPKKFRRLIAVEAPDGTGKSTFIENLCHQIALCYVSDPISSRCIVHHFRPTLLPNLGTIGEKSGVVKANVDFTNPHRAKPTGILSSFIRISYYWLDYLVGVPLLLRNEVQYGKYTFYDRYIYDFLIDPRRSRINLPHWLRKLFTCTVNQPQIVFVLTADSNTIYQRKQELTINEINRQLVEFRKLALSNKRFVEIDANQSPEEMVKIAMSIILEKFFNKV